MGESVAGYDSYERDGARECARVRRDRPVRRDRSHPNDVADIYAVETEETRTMASNTRLRILRASLTACMLLCRPTFTRKGVYYPGYFRGQLCLFEATYTEGKNGYKPSLKVEQGMELTNAEHICGDAVEPIRLIEAAAIVALKFLPITITDAIVFNQCKKEDIYAQARIKIVQLQAPFIVMRCPKLYVSGKNAGQMCLSPVEGGKCRRMHMTDRVGPPLRKLSAWVAFLDADLAKSVQRRAYVRPNALSQITGIGEADLEAMTPGMQETVSKALARQIFVGSFIIAHSHITCVSFTN